MPLLQDVIHKIEVGGGNKYFKVALAFLVVVLLAVIYDIRDYRDFSTQEAMDSAQLARNISEGKGYSTFFIRPFSMYLLQHGAAAASHTDDPARVKGPHPDISNPPVYPVLLAGLMKVFPFHFEVTTDKPFWSLGGRFQRYQPEFVIAVFNEVIFLAVIALSGLLARRLFDPFAGWMTAFLMLATEVFWRFSVSGLSTVLLILVFVGLAWLVVLLESELREPKRGKTWPYVLSILLGLLVGLGGLTRYSFIVMILPLLFFLVVWSTGARRVLLPLVALAAAVTTVVLPWVLRNYHLSGTPFGTAGFAVLEDIDRIFPKDHLQRSLQPDFSQIAFYGIGPFWVKLLNNLRVITQKELPCLGGTWLMAFFAVGLFISFRSPAIRRLRAFTVLCLVIFALTEGIFQTDLSGKSPEVNSENLLVLVAPLAIIFAVGVFCVILDQVQLPVAELRYAVIGGFCVAASLPMIFGVLPPRGSPVSYPPYYPPRIQQVGNWMKPDELLMSDVPWAVAWYGNRPTVWMTLKATKDPLDPKSYETFYDVNDYFKPVKGLYLTSETMDARFLSDWYGGNQSWGSFILDYVVRKAAPSDFPLIQSAPGFYPYQLFLTDVQRWRQ